jgi:hypothetical protein
MEPPSAPPAVCLSRRSPATSCWTLRLHGSPQARHTLCVSHAQAPRDLPGGRPVARGGSRPHVQPRRPSGLPPRPRGQTRRVAPPAPAFTPSNRVHVQLATPRPARSGARYRSQAAAAAPATGPPVHRHGPIRPHVHPDRRAPVFRFPCRLSVPAPRGTPPRWKSKRP